jgi:DUF4097 and DUF4098 domain-containing protein YvlB
MQKLKVLYPVSVSALALLVTGCGSIAGGYRITAGSAHTRSYSSVAGEIEVGQGAMVGPVATVAGDIDIRPNARVASIKSVAGDIHVASNVAVEGSIKTVAGDISIGEGSTVGGSIDSVAGDIRLRDCLVKGDLGSTHGDIQVEHSRVVGVVRAKRHDDKDDDRHSILRIEIGAGSEVGEILVEAGANARVKIHRAAKVGKISGAEPEYID